MESLRRHRSNVDVIRQQPACEKGIVVNLRTAKEPRY
jgi:hypothetical protein